MEAGGVVVCFTQPYGDDFSALPVPAGETLEAAGFKQDLSCFANSAYPTMEHPILSGITGQTVTAGFDGFFRTLPSNATVLLRRSISGEPCLLVYPVGQGFVVASTMYEDWGYANGQSTTDGRALVANMLSWAMAPNEAMPVTNLSAGGSASSISLTLHVRNLSDTPADQMEILVMTPDRQTISAQVSLAISMAPQSEADVPVTLNLSSYFGQAGARYGVFHADYRLLALNTASGQEEEIQPQGEADSGRFVVEKTGADRQALSQTVFSVWTDDDIAGNSAKTVHIHLEDHTGSARTLHLWTCYSHWEGVLLDNITLPANGVLDKDILQDLSRPGPYHYYLTDPVYGFVPSGWWAWMFGNDPWKMAAQGYAYMFGNAGPEGGSRYVSLSQLEGLGGPYDPLDTLFGTVTVASSRQTPQDVRLVFSLLVAGQTINQEALVHLEGNAAVQAPFALTLPGPAIPYRTATVQCAVYAGSTLLARATSSTRVNPWSPNLAMNVTWPTPEAGSAPPVLPIHITNVAGSRVAASPSCALRAVVWELPDDPRMPRTEMERQLLPVPSIGSGDSASVSIQWAEWVPVTGKTYTLELTLFDPNAPPSSFLGLFQSKNFAFTPPTASVVACRVNAGESVLPLRATLVNPGDAQWPVDLAWDFPALSASQEETVVVAPHSSLSVPWDLERPDSLGPGTYVYTVAMAPLGGESGEYSESVHLAAPDLTLGWPSVRPVFRHDQDSAFSLTLGIGNAVAPLPATLDAEIEWQGGSAEVIAGLAITLDPTDPAPVTLTLPMGQMPSPGPFTVRIILSVPQGEVSQSFEGTYSLAGPAYVGGFDQLQAAPGGTLTGDLQNVGGFEGNPQVTWQLRDLLGVMVASATQSLSVPVGGSAPISENLPTNLLPGVYQSVLLTTDVSGPSGIVRQSVTVAGTSPTLALTTDRSVYGTADPVELTLHLDDCSHSFEGAGAHLKVQRYIALGKPDGGHDTSPGASWNTPSLDGSGNKLVNPSAWFVDSTTGSTAHFLDLGADLPDSTIRPIAADISGDGRAEYIGATGAVLHLASEGSLDGVAPGFASPKRHAQGLNGKSETAPDDGSVFKSWLDIPVSRWNQPGDAWTSVFLLGVREEGLGKTNSLCLGLASTINNARSILLVRIDGTVLWRQDSFPPFDTNPVDGPVFADLNGDGIRDLMFQVGTTLYALNGATGEVLWARSFVSSTLTFRIGHADGAVRIWVAYLNTNWQGGTLRLLDPAGETIYEAVPHLGLEPNSLVTADVDGDGSDEAIVSERWNGSWPPLQMFHVGSSEGVTTTIVPKSDFLLSDVNSDGRAEAIYSEAVQNPDNSWTSTLIAADLVSEQLLWSTVLPAPPPEFEPKRRNPIRVPNPGWAEKGPLSTSLLAAFTFGRLRPLLSMDSYGWTRGSDRTGHRDGGSFLEPPGGGFRRRRGQRDDCQWHHARRRLFLAGRPYRPLRRMGNGMGDFRHPIGGWATHSGPLLFPGGDDDAWNLPGSGARDNPIGPNHGRGPGRLFGGRHRLGTHSHSRRRHDGPNR